MMPAQLTRMSRRGKACLASAKARAIALRSPRSAATFTQVRPSADTRASVSSADRVATAAMSAPASGNPIAMAWPSPREAPVTRAVFPSSLKESRMEGIAIPRRFSVRRSAQRHERNPVHIGKRLIVAAHRPDETVAAGPRAAVDRPGWRQDRFAVADDDVAGSVRLAQQMDDDVVAQVEIEVDFGAPAVGVGRHGVP